MPDFPQALLYFYFLLCGLLKPVIVVVVVWNTLTNKASEAAAAAAAANGEATIGCSQLDTSKSEALPWRMWRAVRFADGSIHTTQVEQPCNLVCCLVHAGRVVEKRSIWRLSIFSDVFWGILNIIGLLYVQAWAGVSLVHACVCIVTHR